MELKRISRILVIKLRHIGDVLLTTPTLRVLKQAVPDARITAVVPSGTEDMLTLNPNVEEVVVFKKGQGLSAELGLVNKIRSGRFDLAINMTEGDRGAILAFLSGARCRIGIDPKGKGFLCKKHLYSHVVSPIYDGRHRAVMDMDLLKPLGIGPGEPRAELYTSPGDDAYIEGFLASRGVEANIKTAVVHATSRWLFKCWRDEAVAAVIDYLEGKSIKVVVTSAQDNKELEKAQRILSLARSAPIDLTGRLNLKQLASLLKRSCLFFGVDTAPMHMAAALGTPVVALFGPSDSSLWGPLSPKSRVLSKTADIPCVPCRQDGCNGSKNSRCLDDISVEEAIAAVETIL